MKYFSKTLIVLAVMLAGTAALAQNMVHLNRFSEENAAIEKPADGKPVKGRVVFIGDSITEGWGNQDPDYFIPGKYFERGISGEVTAQMLLRFRVDALALCPSIIVINAGTNDIALNQGDYNEDYTFGNIISMVELAQARKIKVILTTVTPCGAYRWRPEITDSAEKIASLNMRLRKYAIDHKMQFVDYHTFMLGPDGRSMITDYTKDGCHPNIDGYKVMEAQLDKVLK